MMDSTRVSLEISKQADDEWPEMHSSLMARREVEFYCTTRCMGFKDLSMAHQCRSTSNHGGFVPSLVLVVL
ncbi:hypothetical protein BVC80_1745g22 [Macleaya cordata]|uniref:Uncharacterized protein n=1 Tax=Macleaya cordata TaxID=56857 RepID=A0A200QKR5_MACCD|nr:hypothetical protein BVC80_1745g22 [Macleaya cordata]